MYDAISIDLNFFRACPQGKVDTVDYTQLADFKPLIQSFILFFTIICESLWTASSKVNNLVTLSCF